MSSTFKCKYCQRTLPKWMDTGENRCTDCSDGVDTQQTIENIRESQSLPDAHSSKRSPKATSRDSRTQTAGYRGSSEPEVVDPRDYVDSPQGESDSEVSSEEEIKIKTESSSQGLSRQDVSKDPDVQLYHQPSKPNNHLDLPDCDVFSLGWYYSEDFQADSYSSRLIRLCKDGELTELPFFKSHLSAFFDRRFEGDSQQPLLTVYPGHSGEVSDGLATLADRVAKEKDFQYGQILSRIETRPSQHIQSYDNRWDNQRGSIDAQDRIDNKTVFVLDDICTSGASMTVAKDALLKQGADRVIGICLGLSTKQSGQIVKRMQDDKHTIESITNE